MEAQPVSIQEKVDLKLKELEKRYKEGHEDTELYKLKVENLNLVKEVANTGKNEKQGLKEWETKGS